MDMVGGVGARTTPRMAQRVSGQAVMVFCSGMGKDGAVRCGCVAGSLGASRLVGELGVSTQSSRFAA